MKINHNSDWLACKKRLTSAVVTDSIMCERWIQNNEVLASRELSMRYMPGMEGILIGDIFEKYVGLSVDPYLPNPIGRARSVK